MKQKISFNAFKKATHHKPVFFKFEARNGTVKTFNTEKFYSNKHGEMISMPGFLIGKESIFYQKNEDVFCAESEYGVTTFVLGGGEQC